MISTYTQKFNKAHKDFHDPETKVLLRVFPHLAESFLPTGTYNL